jgi:lipopolysaccharide export system protein LptC
MKRVRSFFATHMNRMAVGGALLALAALAWWLPNALTSRTTLFDGERRHDPDYYIENFTATAMNPQGRRKHELRAVKLTHYPDDGTVELEKPNLIQFYPDGPPVHTRADRGYASPDGKEILMRGHVHVTRGAGDQAPAGEVVTQEMKVYLE